MLEFGGTPKTAAQLFSVPFRVDRKFLEFGLSFLLRFLYRASESFGLFPWIPAGLITARLSASFSLVSPALDSSQGSPLPQQSQLETLAATPS